MVLGMLCFGYAAEISPDQFTQRQTHSVGFEEQYGLFGIKFGESWDHQKEIVYMGYRIIFDSGEDGIMYFDEGHD